jgi:hypothetical protein
LGLGFFPCVWASFIRHWLLEQGREALYVLLQIMAQALIVEGCSRVEHRINGQLVPPAGLTASLGDGIPREELGQGMPSQCDDDLGPEELNLMVQVFPAGFYLPRHRVPVVGRAAFHHVGDEDLAPLKANGGQELIQELTRWSYEGFALLVFIESWGLAN